MALVVSVRESAVRPSATATPGEFPVNGYLAVALAGEAEIREEWTAMRNCALQYAGRCSEGVHRVISLRDRDTGVRVMTIVLKRTRGRYVVAEARRRFDRPADAELWSVAERAAVIYGRAGVAARRAERCRRATRAEWPCAEPVLAGSQAALDFGQ